METAKKSNYPIIKFQRVDTLQTYSVQQVMYAATKGEAETV